MSKDLIVANRPFRFIVTGPRADILRQFLVDGRLVRAYQLPRELRSVMGAVLLAEGMDRAVVFETRSGDLIASVSGDRA